MFAIAYRQIVNRYRRAKFDTAPLPETLRAAGETLEDQVIERLQGDTAVAALVVLNDLERDVVLMRVLGGLDTEDVAGAVGKRAGNVRVIQSRAMGKLARRADTARVWNRRIDERGGIGMNEQDLIAAWSRDLAGEVVAPLAAAETGTITAAAVASVGVAGGAVVAATVATHTVAKVIAAAALVTTIGGGVAAVTGTLPDPIQSFVADLVDGLGIDLPRPVVDLPEVTIPTLPSSPEITLPTVTLPTVTSPEVTIPTVTIP